MASSSGVTDYGYCHSLDGTTLFSKVDSNKLRINVKNKMTLIDTKFDADLINISNVTSRKTKWPRFFGLPCISMHDKSHIFSIDQKQFQVYLLHNACTAVNDRLSHKKFTKQYCFLPVWTK